jgi:hypothetical protein
MIRAKASWKRKFSDNQVEQLMPGKFESRFSNRVFMSISVRTRPFYLQTVPSRLVPEPFSIKLNALVRTSEFRAIVNLDLWRRSLWDFNRKSHYLHSCINSFHALITKMSLISSGPRFRKSAWVSLLIPRCFHDLSENGILIESLSHNGEFKVLNWSQDRPHEISTIVLYYNCQLVSISCFRHSLHVWNVDQRGFDGILFTGLA